MEIKSLKVSIITPVYNCEGFIAETIQSVLDQTHENFELLLIDDCSTDDTIEIVKSFNDPRIVLIQNKENKGAAFSRNSGIAHASGDYIAFLDADDLWEETKLEKCLNFMLANNYDFIYTNYSVIKDDGGKTDIIISGPKRITHRMFRRSNYVGCSTVVYKKSIYPDLHIPESIKKRNDYALWLLLSKNTDCYLLDECLTKYRKNSLSISSGKKANLLKHHYQVFREVCGYSAIKSYFYTLVNIGFYFLRRRKYRRKHADFIKSGERLENGFFIVLTLFLVMFAFIFGNSVNAIKGETMYLNATNFSEKYSSVHLRVSSDSGLDYNASDKYLRGLYARRSYLNPYYKYNGELKLQYESNTFDVSLCTSPVYNDFEYTEYLSLPLYKENSSIRSGPRNEAEFASYIPSSIADQLLEKLGLNTFDELLSKDIVFTLKTSKEKCTMSINNIYLNSETDHWNNRDIEFDYYKTFSKRTTDALFAYCPGFFRTIGKGSLCFDMNTSYDHFKSIANSTLDFVGDSNEKVTYEITRDDGEALSYSLSKQDLKTNFGDFNHIITYVGVGIIIFNIVFLMLSKSFRQNMMKPALTSCVLVLFVLFLGELFKTIFPTKTWPFYAFNYIGNGISILILIYLLVIAYYFKEEKKDD